METRTSSWKSRARGLAIGIGFSLAVSAPSQGRTPPTPDPNTPVDITMDGETFRYFVETLLPDPDQPDEALSILFNEVLPQIRQVHFQGTRKDLRLEAEFYHSIPLSFMKRKQAREFQLYQILVPSHLRFRLAYRDPEIILENVGSARKSFIVRLRIPLFLDNVYFHRVTFNPLTGDVEAKAGILGDLIRVRKRGNIFKKKKPATPAPGASTGHFVTDLLMQLRPMLLPFLAETWEKD